MLRVISISHSLISARQWMLFEKIGEMNLAECLVLCPSRWHDEKCIDLTKHNFASHCLETVGKSFYTFRLRGLEQYIQEFQPDVIYIEEEPHTILARECVKIAHRESIPYAVFSWENIENRRFGEPLDSIEKEVIKSADVLIAGNEGAKRRLIARGGEEEKISICPQTGVNQDLFQPRKEIEKSYDLLYAGRLVEEKGVRFIEHVAKELQLKILWIGGRGSFIPTYGNYIGWLPDYLHLPEYYNKTKLFVTYPYSYHGYSEQANMTIGESLACGTPVVTSDNGSIKEFYDGAPISIAAEGNESALKDAVSYALTDLENYPCEKGREWVRNNLSNEVIGRKLIEILKTGKW